MLTSAFLGRLCLSGDVAALPKERWQQALDAIALYAQVRHIIRDGFTDVIVSTVQDYSKPKGYQIVRRTLGEEALVVVHTFEGVSNPPISKWVMGYREIKRFGSPLDGELRGMVIWCRK